MGYKTILLIDDDTEDHEIFKAALQEVSDNLNCESYTNAREALNKLSDRELNPDVIFLDLNMPVMSGEEFLRKIKSIGHLSAIPVIMFTTSSNPATIAVTKELGAMDFITKPNRFDTLIDILKPIIT